MAKVLKTDVEGLISAIESAYADIESKTDWEWHRNLWDESVGVEGWFELVKTIKPEMTLSEWDKAWQYRIINHPDYKQSKLEFINALIGWY